MRRKKGLTLVELLIVIGIVVILTILISVVFFNIWREKKISQCIYNLKQIGTALAMYASDNDGFIPPYTNVLCRENYRDESGEERWIDTTPYIKPEFLEGAYLPYTKNRQIWFCWQDPYAGREGVWMSVQHKFTSYLISSWIPYFSPILLDHPPSDRIPPWFTVYKEMGPFFYNLYLRQWREEESQVYAFDRYHELTDLFWFELTFDGQVKKGRASTGPLPKRKDLRKRKE